MKKAPDSKASAAGRSVKAAHRRRSLPLDDRQTAYIQTVPPKWRASIEKLFREGGTVSQALRLNCMACVGWEDSISRIRECDITICPANRFRPFQDKAEE